MINQNNNIKTSNLLLEKKKHESQKKQIYRLIPTHRN
jgi:hypothetical protein